MSVIDEFTKEWRYSEAMKRQMDQLLLMVVHEDPDRMDIKEGDGSRNAIIELLKWKKQHGAVSESTSPSMTDMPTPYP